MIVLFDSNVLISGLTTSQLCHEIIEIVLREHEPLTSPTILEEASRSIQKKFKSHRIALAALNEFGHYATRVNPSPLSKPISRDPDDDWVLAAAIEGGANCIVTGDQDLLVLKKYKSIPILTPRQFLEMISGTKS